MAFEPLAAEHYVVRPSTGHRAGKRTASLGGWLLRAGRGIAAGTACRGLGPVDNVRRQCRPILKLLQNLLDLVAAVRQLRALLVDVLRGRQPLLELGCVRLARRRAELASCL